MAAHPIRMKHEALLQFVIVLPVRLFRHRVELHADKGIAT